MLRRNFINSIAGSSIAIPNEKILKQSENNLI